MTLVEYAQSEGIIFTKKGNEYWASCPFHEDNSPSFSITGDMWYCFSCKKGGGPINFISEYKNVTLYNAKRMWMELNGKILIDNDREKLTRLVESLAVDGHPYLRGRGIGDEICKKFKIGYCDNYQAFLTREGIDSYTASELGLFDFSGCIIYPFYDDDGVYKIAARSIKEKIYNNSNKDSKFHKDGFFGMQNIRGDEIWIFEGYHDCLVAAQEKYMAVAAAGTNITKNMWNELKRFKRIVIVPDGDLGGRSWLDRISKDYPIGLPVEFIVLPNGDPDDFMLSNQFNFKSIIPYQWILSKYPVNTIAEKIKAVKESSEYFLKLSKDQRVLVKSWFKETFGDDEALDYIYVDQEPDIDSERVVLANCLYSKNIRLETVQELDESFFSTKLHKNMFNIIMEKEATPQLIQVELGVDYSNYVDLINYRIYIDNVLLVGRRNKVSKVLSRADLSDISSIVEDLYKVTDHLNITDSKELVTKVMKIINDRVTNPNMLGIPIDNFPTLNKVLMGWVNRRFILLSGNSGYGKTTLACNFIDNLIDKYPVLFITLEMTEEEILEKQISIRSGIPSMKIQTGSLTQDEYDRVSDVAEHLKSGNLQIIYGVNDIYKIVALIKAFVIRKKIRFVVIDYLQLITIKSSDERWEQLSAITKILKNQVCSLGVTLFLVSQLKRSALNQDLPDASEQAGAYAILADSDVGMTIKKQDPRENEGSNFLIYVSKHRFGIDNVAISCEFDKNNQKIIEL